jgi:hypothetical protein
MFAPSLALALATLLLSCQGPPESIDPAAKKLQQLAKDAAVKFYESFEGRDLDRLLAIVDAPWYHDGKAVLADKADIAYEFKTLLEKRRSLTIRKVPDVKAVLAYGMVRARTDEKDRKMLDQVIREDDFLVLVMLKPEMGKPGATENVVVIVKVRDGIAKVVGVKN